MNVLEEFINAITGEVLCDTTFDRLKLENKIYDWRFDEAHNAYDIRLTKSIDYWKLYENKEGWVLQHVRPCIE